MKKSLFISIITLVLSVSLTLITHAQQIDFPSADQLTRYPLQLTVTPRNPKPGQPVTVKVYSSLINLDGAKITWIINETPQKTETGKTSIQLVAGGSGVTTTVGVGVVTPDGKTYAELTSFRPAEVDLVWEGKSYTPPFYKGRALYPYQGEITIVALPDFVQNGTIIDPKTLVYTWDNDGDALGGAASGYGKNSVTLTQGIILRPLNIRVRASTPDGSISGVGETVINPTELQNRLYEDNPLYGVLYNRALSGNISLKNQELTLRSAPYFFSTNNSRSTRSLSFDWTINGRSVDPKNNGRDTLVLKRPENQSGVSQVSVTTTNSSKLLQFITSFINLTFTSNQ